MLIERHIAHSGNGDGGNIHTTPATVIHLPSGECVFEPHRKAKNPKQREPRVKPPTAKPSEVVMRATDRTWDLPASHDRGVSN